jgi:hypothetical protein
VESESTLTLALHGVNIGLLLAILGFMLKQYTIYKSIRERVNIVWRDYCRVHRIPYNALGDDELMDVKNGGENS